MLKQILKIWQILIDGKKLELMKKRQYRSNQGRSPKQQCETLKVLSIAIIGLILTTIYLVLK